MNSKSGHAFGRRIASALVMVMCAHHTAALADSDKFMCVDGITGDVTDQRFQGCIELLVYSQEYPIRDRTPGGDRSCFEVAVVKPIDSASPQLFLAALSEQPLSSVNVFFRSKPPEKRVFFIARMKNVLIRRIRNSERPSDESGTATSIAMEDVLLVPDVLRIQFTPDTDGGVAGGPIEAGWNCFRNQPV